MSNYGKAYYLGKKWKVIDILPKGSLVLQRWCWRGIFPYRGVVFTSLSSVTWDTIIMNDPKLTKEQKKG